MKTPLIPLTFGMASVVGFGVVYWSKPALTGTARTAAAAAPAQVFSVDEISARIKADPALVVKGEPASIADQLR